MVKGIGIDIIELKRIKKVLRRHPRFLHRILSEKEIELFHRLPTENRKIEKKRSAKQKEPESDSITRSNPSKFCVAQLDNLSFITKENLGNLHMFQFRIVRNTRLHK